MPPKSITWTTEQIKLGDLIEWEHNPVKLSDHDAEQIQISIEKFGLVLPLVANRPKTKTNTKRRLIDGHQRKTILIYSKIATPDTLLDVRIPSRKLTDRECNELSIRLRRNIGELDYSILVDEFVTSDLLDWGFQEKELDVVPDEDEWVSAFGALPNSDRIPFQQMTFVLHDIQIEQVKEAMGVSKAMGDFVDSPNENSNGNALMRICELFISDHG